MEGGWDITKLNWRRQPVNEIILLTVEMNRKYSLGWSQEDINVRWSQRGWRPKGMCGAKGPVDQGRAGNSEDQNKTGNC